MIHIIADSTSAIPQEMLSKYSNLHVIPLSLSIKGEYIPENEATIRQVIEYSEKTNQAIPTSQPSTGDFLNAFNLISEKDDIIVLCITTAVSGTYNGAVLAAKQSGRGNISVINTKTTAVGMLQMVQDALEFIESGNSFAEITDKLTEVAEHMRTTFTVDTLDYLRRGGRIGKAAGLIGSILKIKPCIYLNKNNEVDVLDKVRTRKKAVASLIKYLDENAPCKRIGIVHIENPEGGKELQSIVQEKYPDIDTEDFYVDATAMYLVTQPQEFQVIVTTNLFGDILSDEASMVTGSIGMLSSASLNDTKFGLYEPSGGSAPDIAGKGIANPIATILSAAMMLRYTFDLDEEASAIEKAVKKVLEDGYRTIDIMPQDEAGKQKVTQVGTKEMGDLICERI